MKLRQNLGWIFGLAALSFALVSSPHANPTTQKGEAFGITSLNPGQNETWLQNKLNENAKAYGHTHVSQVFQWEGKVWFIMETK